MRIELFNNKQRVILDFGNIISLRVIDEGYVQKDIYNYAEIKQYKQEKFANVLYRVEGGEYLSEIREISGGYAEAMGSLHFVIITQNYNMIRTPKVLFTASSASNC